MDKQSRMGLFGAPSPEDIRSKIGRINEADISLAAMSPLQIPVAMASQQARDIGTVVGESLFGSPEARKYKKIQSIMQGTPFNPAKPVDYYQELASQFHQAGLPEQSLMALEQSRLSDIKERETVSAEVGSNTALVKAQTALAQATADLTAPQTPLGRLQQSRTNLEATLRNDEVPPIQRADARRKLLEVNKRIFKENRVTGLTPDDVKSREAKILADRDSLVMGLEDTKRVREIIAKDPSLAGIPGVAQKSLKYLYHTSEDIRSFIEGSNRELADTVQRDIESGFLSEELAAKLTKTLTNPDIDALQYYETGLSYKIAGMNKGGGRLNVQDFDNARKLANVTGFTTSESVLNRYDLISKDFERGIKSLTAQLEGKSLYNIREEAKKEREKEKKERRVLKLTLTPSGQIIGGE